MAHINEIGGMKMLNTTEKLKIALGDPLRKTIGGQEFEFYPLDVTVLPDFFELYSKLEGHTDEKSIMKVMGNKENSSIIVNLIVKMLKDSFGEETDIKLINKFAMKYFAELQEVLMELHQPSEGVDIRKKDRLKEMRERVKKTKDVKPTTEDKKQSPK